MNSAIPYVTFCETFALLVPQSHTMRSQLSWLLELVITITAYYCLIILIVFVLYFIEFVFVIITHNTCPRQNSDIATLHIFGEQQCLFMKTEM